MPLDPPPADRSAEVHALRNALGVVATNIRLARIRAEHIGVTNVVFPPELLDRINRALDTAMTASPEEPTDVAPR